MKSEDVTHCPTVDEIRHYAAGGFSDEHATELETHLLNCSHCDTLLDGLDDPSDVVIQALTALPLSPDDEADYRTLRTTALAAPTQFSDEQEASSILQRNYYLAAPKIGTLPRELGNYELLACIGRGASGAVYRARHLKLEQTVAIKVLDESRSASADAFKQEIKTIGSLAHPNIVRATDADVADGFHYLVMEYVEGIDAAQLLFRNGPLSIADACEIARQASLGLQFIHQQQLVHRDIKPSNLLVTTDGQVKLLDMGIATADDRIISPSKPQGTTNYMPPELWSTTPEVSTSGDIYSLGVTLFKLLTSSYPAYPVSDNLEFGRKIPRSINRLLRRMLAPTIEGRLQSAQYVADTLKPYARRANLRQLLADCCPDLKIQSTNGRSKLPFVSRRTAIVMAATAASALLFARNSLHTKQQLRRSTWRPLAPESPEILFNLGQREDVKLDYSIAGRIDISSAELVLLHLGRPVNGLFQLEVWLQGDNNQQSGLFFQGYSDYSKPIPEMRFQTLDLTISEGKASSDHQQYLVWCQWNVTILPNQSKVQRIPLAEIPVDRISRPQGQHLQIAFGRQGMPEIVWNGELLHESLWQFSAEARSLQKMSASQSINAYLGRLGLVNSNGSTTFYQPRLAYL